eukprot:CAMPEP_0168589940 /NCGR_PEP_ID=MMETSP0420-20121227/6287_1 /TAXON_ID=498008 /ORGANISM="Pessonella sp." /LENGTH=423 /DNA_ID=CAMNT_0008625535 /DNA_START=51 /DNA_END=1322 /DNA_ORIENTATION=-
MAQIYVLHENDEWIQPLREAFNFIGVPFVDWHLGKGGCVDLSSEPPVGVFYNRMSASAHTRDHAAGPSYAAAVLEWLELHDRVVVNGTKALALEISKVRQYTALRKGGILVPRTVAVVGRNEADLKRRVVEQARAHFGDGAPFVTKHNCGGKGLGVHRHASPDELAAHVHSNDYETPNDGVLLLQQYVPPVDAHITRCEFVGGKFLYAVQVDASSGFQLCPADKCTLEDQRALLAQKQQQTQQQQQQQNESKEAVASTSTSATGAFCPASSLGSTKFTISKAAPPTTLLEAYEQLLARHDIQVAGIEFLTDADGQQWTYDINTNTNYNRQAEYRRFGKKECNYGMHAVAEYLSRLCWQLINEQLRIGEQRLSVPRASPLPLPSTTPQPQQQRQQPQYEQDPTIHYEQDSVEIPKHIELLVNAQ